MIAALVAASLFSWADAGATDRVALRPAADAAILAAGIAGFVVPQLLKDQLAPAECVICDGASDGPNAVDATFHDALTGWLVSRKTADTASNVWAFALLPVATFAGALTATGPHATSGAGARAAVIVLESSSVSAALVEGIKFVAGRRRPFVRYGNAEATGTYGVQDRDSHLGFPSGHTALATSLGVSLAMTAQLQDSSAAPWLWGAAAAMSVTTASLRMMAEKHYFTDVVSGAAIGAACGVVFPLMHRRGSALAPGAVSVAGGPSLSFSGTF